MPKYGSCYGGTRTRARAGTRTALRAYNKDTKRIQKCKLGYKNRAAEKPEARYDGTLVYNHGTQTMAVDFKDIQFVIEEGFWIYGAEKQYAANGREKPTDFIATGPSRPATPAEIAEYLAWFDKKNEIPTKVESWEAYLRNRSE